ncbi:MAG: hypothetical protein ACRD3L_18265 [Terriglobales bacterium]
MKLQRLFCVLLGVGLVVPVAGQVHPQSELDSLLRATSNALDRYQQIAPTIHCEDASAKALSDSCKMVLQMLESDVQDAKDKVARYRRLPDSDPGDLFDIYFALQQIMEGVDNLNYAPQLYGERNRVPLADVYNNFVKVFAWFGGELKDITQDAEKRSACPHT